MTLLPAATEIVAALGNLHVLVGISHECDYPPSVQHLPRVTTTPISIQASSRSIDAEVRRLHESGQPVIAVDPDQLSRVAPDLIITQDLCEVCAVSDGQVHRLATLLRPGPRVLSLQGRDLQGIWRNIYAVGLALDLADESEELVLGLQYQLKRLNSPRPHPPPRVLCIEWLEPLYLAGHWVPDLVAAAGGHDIGAQSGCHSARHEWGELARLRPDHIFIMLCGFGVERARAELEQLTNPTAIELLRGVPTWIIDGNAYTSRPGPRVVEGARRIRAAITGECAPQILQWQPAEYAEH